MPDEDNIVEDGGSKLPKKHGDPENWRDVNDKDDIEDSIESDNGHDKEDDKE